MNFKHFFLSIMMSVLTFVPVSLAASQYSSDQVKAVYLFRIASFVRWDNEGEMDRVRFCIEGNEGIKSTLTEIVKDKKIRDLEIEVAQKTTQECEVVFLSSKVESLNLNRYGPETLTVSDVHGFTRMGGVIELETIKSRIRPLINLSNTDGAPFSIGSKLLRVSKVEGY